MILVDSLMVAGLRWVLDAIAQAATAERDDDTPLREALLEAALRHEAGELSEEEFARFEEDVLARIHAIRERRGAGALAFAGPATLRAGEALQVDAAVAGDFHEPALPARTRRKPRTGPAC